MDNLNAVAAEMKAVAEQYAITLAQMIDGITNLTFPKDLKRHIVVEVFGGVHIQYTHDQLSDTKGLHHLSFSRDDQAEPQQDMKDTFRVAFFGDDPSIVFFPGQLGNHVAHLAKIVTLK